VAGGSAPRAVAPIASHGVGAAAPEDDEIGLPAPVDSVSGDDDVGLPAPARPAPPPPRRFRTKEVVPDLADVADDVAKAVPSAPDEQELDLPPVGRGTLPTGTASTIQQGAAVTSAGLGVLGLRGRTASGDEAGEADFPAVAGRVGGESDLPAVANVRQPTSEIDLPSLDDGLDLPAVGGAVPLDADLPAVGDPFGSDLPAPAGSVDLDLPEVSGALGADLPMVGGPLPSDLPVVGRSASDLPSPAGSSGVDLPMVGGSSDGVGLPAPGASLPAVAGGIDLPSPGGAFDLPSVGGPGLPTNPKQSLGLPLPSLSPGAELPTPAENLPTLSEPPDPGMHSTGDQFGEVAFGEVGGSAPPAALGAFGEVDFPQADPADGLGADPFAASVPPPPSGPPPGTESEAQEALVRQAGGGVGYGEVNLGGGDETGEMPLDASEGEEELGDDDDMEFGAIPQEDGEAESGPDDGMHVRMAVGERIEPVKPGRRKKRRVLRVALFGLTAVVLGGAALALTPYGPFGAWMALDLLYGAEHEKLLTETVTEARQLLAADTYPQAKQAVALSERARKQAARVEALKAYASFVAFVYELRFGEDMQTRATATENLAELQGDDGVPHLELARAAQEAVSGQLAKVDQKVANMARREPNNIDVRVLQGELMLRAQKPDEALAAWQAAEKIEKSARTAFGLARAYFAKGDAENAERHARETMKRNPAHVGARILMARVAWTLREDEPGATQLIDAVLKNSKQASPPELVDVRTLQGDVHLQRSRVSKAEEAFGEALKLDPKAAGALEGLGEALYQAGRYSEALARFEAGTKADPDDLDVKVGVAKTLLALERIEDAKPMLDKLAESHPKSMEVAYWHGEALVGVGKKGEAKKAFLRAIATGGDDPQVVHAYVSLARLLAGDGQPEEAQKKLDEAKSKLPSSPTLHKALGELALQQGRYEDAMAEFSIARKLAPHDVGALFKIGVVQRRSRDFEGALETFDEVAKLDEQYPGLSLERGLVYEAAGRTEEALKAYKGALAKAPDDLDLKLRVGCATVVAGQAADATKLLLEVLQSRGNSADANHCLGRAYFLEGDDPIVALRYLNKAVDLDPHKAVHYLYVGRASLDAGKLADADRALRKALEIDQSLADAYWQRGVLRYKQGRAKDAEADIRKALELRPSLYEAHADLAAALRDLNREDEALQEWKAATSAYPDNADWQFRYGKLLADRAQLDAARPHLDKAIEIASKDKSPPVWLAQAHMLYARSLGNNPQAIRHWEYFMQHSQLDNPYRDEAKSQLRVLGKPWED